MSFFDRIKYVLAGKKQENAPEDTRKYDIDGDGHPMYREDIIQYVRDALERRKNERKPLERQWVLNSNFLIGNQYCGINPYRDDIEQYEPVHDWMERETFNRIAPLVETRIANIKRVNYLMSVKPRTNELDDYAKAETSTAVLRYLQDTTDFDSKTDTMILWNELCGNAFWLAWWDKDKGMEYARSAPGERNAEQGMAADAEAVTGYGAGAMRQRVIYEGDIDYGILTPYEVYPESVFRQRVESQQSVIVEQVRTVDEIYDEFGIRLEGKSIDTFSLTPLPSGGGFGYEGTVTAIGHKTVENAESVITYFERGSKLYPTGRLIIIVGDSELVYYGDLPYDTIPIVQVVCKEVAGQFFGRSIIEDLIPLQRAYNGCVNRIHEYIKRIAIGSYIVEEGAIDVDEYEEYGCAPGSLLRYAKGYTPPIPVQNAELPRELAEERVRLERDMEYVAAVSQLMAIGAAPAGVNSGVAIENLRGIDDTRLSLTADRIRGGVRELAKLWLSIYKRYANSQRVLNIVGTNSIGNAIWWCGDDINSFDIQYDTENELINSEEAQRQRFIEAFQLGMFTDADGSVPQSVKRKVLEFAKVNNYQELMDINLLQVQAAQRENAFFEVGNGIEVSAFDDHEIHIDEHIKYVLQMKYLLLKRKNPEYALAFEEHIAMHRNALEAAKSQQMMEMQQIQQIQDMNGGT